MGNAKSMSLGPEAAAVVTKAISSMPSPPVIETGIFAAGEVLWYLQRNMFSKLWGAHTYISVGVEKCALSWRRSVSKRTKTPAGC